MYLFSLNLFVLIMSYSIEISMSVRLSQKHVAEILQSAILTKF